MSITEPKDSLTMDIVEVMARSIAGNNYADEWSKLDACAQQYCRQDARAILSALADAGLAVVHKRDYVDKAEAWDALYRPAKDASTPTEPSRTTGAST